MYTDIEVLQLALNNTTKYELELTPLEPGETLERPWRDPG